MLALDWFTENYSDIEWMIRNLNETQEGMSNKVEKYHDKIKECEFLINKASQMKVQIFGAMNIIRNLPNYAELRMAYENMKATEEKMRLERERLELERRKARAQEDAARAAEEQAQTAKEQARIAREREQVCASRRIASHQP